MSDERTSAVVRRWAAIMLAERIGVGAAAALAPGALMSTFGIEAGEDSPTLRYFARLFGIRNAVLGMLVWQARNDPQRLAMLAGVNAVTEVFDACAGIVPLATGQTDRRTGTAVVLTSLAVSAGFAGLAVAARRSYSTGG